jgi:hypothetical protein
MYMMFRYQENYRKYAKIKIMVKNICNYNNGLLTEREVCTVKYQTEVF